MFAKFVVQYGYYEDLGPLCGPWKKIILLLGKIVFACLTCFNCLLSITQKVSCLSATTCPVWAQKSAKFIAILECLPLVNSDTWHVTIFYLFDVYDLFFLQAVP